MVPQRGVRFTTTMVRSYDGEFEKLDRLRQLVEAGLITLGVGDWSFGSEARDRARRRHGRSESAALNHPRGRGLCGGGSPIVGRAELAEVDKIR